MRSKLLLKLVTVLSFVSIIFSCDTDCCEGLCSQSIGNSNKKTQKLKTTVQFNANGGTGTMSNQIFEQGVEQQLYACTFVSPSDSDGFDSWNTKNDGTGIKYTDKQKVKFNTEQTLVLYAIWKSKTPLKITVQFNANEGSGTMSNQVFEKGIAQKLTKCSFTKPQFAISFKCWNTKSDGTGTSYQDEESLTITADTTLYAIWKSNGRISGEPPVGSKKQGEIQTESYTDASGNVKINGTVIPFTSEVVVVPAGCVATVTMEDDSSWSSYYIEDESYKDSMKGVFVKNRKIKLDSFVMEQYEVTQNLYAQVMELTPTTSNLPVVNITWYQACAFCNEYTQKVNGNDTQCVYYSDSELTEVYTKNDADNELQLYPAYDSTNCKWLKTGYRLPTEAEWEYAARGGNPNNEEWKYAYAGVQSSYCLEELFNNDEDPALNEYACYNISNYNLIEEVGILKPNSLGLYDMSGNASEFIFDRLINEEGNYICLESATKYDAIYTKDGYVSNPFSETGDFHIFRGGCVSDEAYYCSVSIRCDYKCNEKDPTTGFRVCRTIK